MREMNFDSMVTIDGVRWIYRGVITYAIIELYRRYNVSNISKKGFEYIEKEFWKPSNTFVSIRPKTRYLYSVMTATWLW